MPRRSPLYETMTCSCSRYARSVGRGPEASEARIEEADERTAEERAARDGHGQIVDDRDRQVDAPRRQRLAHGTELHGHADQPHARRLALEAAQEGRDEPFVGRVGEPDAQRAVRGERRLSVPASLRPGLAVGEV